MQDHGCGIIIDGVHTDIFLKVYSQYKKFGSMVTVCKEAALNDFNSDIYSIKTLFGKDDTDVHLAARFIAEQININQPMLLSICLKNYNVESLRTIVTAINQLKPW